MPRGRSTRIKHAIEILKRNVEMLPQGFNTYDSLGEGYMENGYKNLALQNYKTSLQSSPKNTSSCREAEESWKRRHSDDPHRGAMFVLMGCVRVAPAGRPAHLLFIAKHLMMRGSLPSF